MSDFTTLYAALSTATLPPAPASEPAVRVDPLQRLALVDDRVLPLSYLEFELLAYLVANPYRVHSRSSLLRSVWGYDYDGGSRTIDVHIARLRAKLGPAHRQTIETLRKVGYRYRPVSA